jgi:hypothetical protein
MKPTAKNSATYPDIATQTFVFKDILLPSLLT